MAGQIRVAPGALRQGGQGISDAGQRLAVGWQDFSAKVQGMGDIFGDDPIGGLIGASYQMAHQIAERSVGSVAGSLTGFGAGLARMAGGYDAAEQAVAGGAARLAREL